MKNNKKRLGEALKKAREDAGLSLRDAAERFRVNNSTISRWETGDNDIPATKLIDYVNMLGISIDDFFANYYERS